MQGFSLGEAYSSLLNVLEEDLDWVWKGKKEPKLKFFFLLLWLDRLPDKSMLTIVKLQMMPHALVAVGGLKTPLISSEIVRLHVIFR